MKQLAKRTGAVLCTALVLCCGSVVHASDPPEFRSHLFQKGTLVYSDDFDEGFDQKRWQPRTQSWEVKGGVLVGKPDYDNVQEAMETLKRDHHLGMSPVIRLNDLPGRFVLHFRVKFEGSAFATGRPKFDIGHHINTVVLNAEGYSIKLHGGESYRGRASDVHVNEWVDVVLEFEPGKMWVGVNGEGQTIEHDQVSLEGRSELTFKTFADAPNRIFFDTVRLWKVD